jgi:hypothetical protein
LGVSRQGEFKNTTKFFLQKVHVENFSQNFDKTFDVSFSSTIFCFIAFLGVSQRWELKNTTKNVVQKKSCRKFFTKKSTKNPKPTLSRFFFYHVSGRFSMRGGQKHDKKYQKNKSDPSPFSYFDPPTHHGGHRFFFGRPRAGW